MEDMLSTLEDEVSLRVARAVKQQREAAGFSLRMLAARSGVDVVLLTDHDTLAAKEQARRAGTTPCCCSRARR